MFKNASSAPKPYLVYNFVSFYQSFIPYWKDSFMSASSSSKSRTGLLLGVLGIAVIILIAAIAISQSGTKDTPKGSAATKKVETLLNGIPQNGPELGNPNAPITIEEFVDLQCPFCKEFTTNVLPTLITKYIRTGKVKVRLRVLTFIGDDSDTAGRFSSAAALQNKQWTFTELFFYNQKTENSGYVTDKFVRNIAKQIKGLDTEKLFKDRETEKAVKPLDEAATIASSNKITSTPSFLIGHSGKPLTRLNVTALEAKIFSQAIDELLKEHSKM